MNLQKAIDLGIPKGSIRDIKSFCVGDKTIDGILWGTEDAAKRLKALEMVSSHYVDEGMISFPHEEYVPDQQLHDADVWLAWGKKNFNEKQA